MGFPVLTLPWVSPLHFWTLLSIQSFFPCSGKGRKFSMTWSKVLMYDVFFLALLIRATCCFHSTCDVRGRWGGRRRWRFVRGGGDKGGDVVIQRERIGSVFFYISYKSFIRLDLYDLLLSSPLSSVFLVRIKFHGGYRGKHTVHSRETHSRWQVQGLLLLHERPEKAWLLLLLVNCLESLSYQEADTQQCQQQAS